MSRVDAYIAQVESEKKTKSKSGGSRKRGKSRLATIYLLCLLALIILIELVGESLPALTPLIDLPTPIWAIVPTLLGGLAALRRNWRGVIVNGLSICAAIYLMSPVWFKGDRTPESPIFRVMTFNIEHGAMPNMNLNMAMRGETEPDVILMQEATELRDDENMRKLLLHGYTIFVTEHIALASKYPVDEIREIHLTKEVGLKPGDTKFGPNPEDHQYAQIAKIRWNNQSIYVVNTHLTPNAYSRKPLNLWEKAWLVGHTTDYRMAQARALHKLMDKIDGPIIFAGDFNNQPFGKVYRELKGNFMDSWREAGFGFGWTIEAERPYKRCDYQMHNDFWRADRARIGKEIGSDHRAYWVDYELVKPWKLELAKPIAGVKPPQAKPRPKPKVPPVKLNHGIPAKKPALNHGIPAKKPALNHGVPAKKPTLNHGIPAKKPKLNHGIPAKKPTLNHGIPPKKRH